MNFTYKIILGICLSICTNSLAQKNIKCSKKESNICEWVFAGNIGQYVDKISESRILDIENWENIYNETEEAFKKKEDDINYPNIGRWRGEFWGKYILSAIAASEYYHSNDLPIRIEEAVKGFLYLQAESGYIGTYTHSDFVIGDNWNIWCRKYTLWALVEAWELLGDESILMAAEKFTEHLMSEVGPGKIDIVKTGNYYGLASSSILFPLVKLYKATGEKKYLQFCEYIVKQWTKHPEGIPDILNKGLSEKPIHLWFPKTDPYKWAKGYEFISCVEGLLQLFEVTGNHKYLEAGKNIHSLLVKWERTPIGSIGFQDKFVGAVGLINSLSEICDAVYWNRLSIKLFKLTGETKYIEEIERTLYNTLLSAYNLKGNWGLRRVRMSHVHIPATNHFLFNHQCCVDNLPRGLFQASEVVLTKRNEKVFLSLFNEGRGKVILPSKQSAYINIYGDFIEKESVKISFSLDNPEIFSFQIRNPSWSKGVKVKVNGSLQEDQNFQKWFEIKRKWKNGDEIEVYFEMDVWHEKFNNNDSSKYFNKKEFYENIWANSKFELGSNHKINNMFEGVKSLSTNDALSHESAVVFYYGPIVLSRDERITNGDIFAPIKFSEDQDVVEIRKLKQTSGQVWKVFELIIGTTNPIKFCDFSSAGNTWDVNQKFNTWCILGK